MLEFVLIASIKVIAVILVLLTGCAYSTYLERKVVAFMQHRIGPLYAGPYGLLQPVADAIKLIFKEDIVPDRAERFAYTIAPMISFMPAVLVFAVVPFSSDFSLFGRHISGVISDLNIGVFWVFMIGSLGVYGTILAGWSSGSKYSLLGGLRATAQTISYELAYGLSIVGVIILANTLSMTELLPSRRQLLIGISGNNRSALCCISSVLLLRPIAPPFDLPEAESELWPVFTLSTRRCVLRRSLSANMPT